MRFNSYACAIGMFYAIAQKNYDIVWCLLPPVIFLLRRNIIFIEWKLIPSHRVEYRRRQNHYNACAVKFGTPFYSKIFGWGGKKNENTAEQGRGGGKNAASVSTWCLTSSTTSVMLLFLARYSQSSNEIEISQSNGEFLGIDYVRNIRSMLSSIEIFSVIYFNW